MQIYIILAILPAILLLFYIWKKDPTEKEPVNMLLKLAGYGALTTITAVVFGLLAQMVLDAFVQKETTLYVLLETFLTVALIEEGGKYFMLLWRTWKAPEFDYSYDAVVYSVAVSLGFATVENILYVVFSTAPLEVALMRGILSVPGHAIFALFMGYYVGQAKRCSCIGNHIHKVGYWCMALLVPVFLHGTYDFLLSLGNEIAVGIFALFEVAMTVSAIWMINTISKEITPVAAEYRPLRQQIPQPPFPPQMGYAQPQQPMLPQQDIPQQPQLPPHLQHLQSSYGARSLPSPYGQETQVHEKAEMQDLVLPPSPPDDEMPSL